MTKIKPCRVCKGTNIKIEKWTSGGKIYMVKCNNPNCPVPFEGYPKGRDLEDVKAEWNKRQIITKEDIIILEVKDSTDADYGNSIVRYTLPDMNFESYIFSKQDAIDHDDNIIKQEIMDQISENGGINAYPLWSDMSDTLWELIADSEFDMRFAEYDDEEWNGERAEKIIKEAAKWQSLNKVVEYGEDSYITIFAGAMCCVNWYGYSDGK